MKENVTFIVGHQAKVLGHPNRFEKKLLKMVREKKVVECMNQLVVK